MAVLPTPASPSSTGLFFCGGRGSASTRSISLSRPITGSSLPWRASSVRSRPKLSSAGVLLLAGLLPGGRCRGPFARLGGLPAVSEQVQDFLADVFELHSQVHQHLGGDAFLFAEQAEQEMFGADVVVIEVAGLFHRVFDDFLGPRRLGQLAHRHHVGTRLDDLFDFQADLAQIDIEVLQHFAATPRAFLHQPEQDVLGADVFVVEALGLLIGQLHHFSGSIGKSFVHPVFSRPVQAIWTAGFVPRRTLHTSQSRATLGRYDTAHIGRRRAFSPETGDRIDGRPINNTSLSQRPRADCKSVKRSASPRRNDVGSHRVAFGRAAATDKIRKPIHQRRPIQSLRSDALNNLQRAPNSSAAPGEGQGTPFRGSVQPCPVRAEDDGSSKDEQIGKSTDPQVRSFCTVRRLAWHQDV